MPNNEVSQTEILVNKINVNILMASSQTFIASSIVLFLNKNLFDTIQNERQYY
jgi:hypothetical protein